MASKSTSMNPDSEFTLTHPLPLLQSFPWLSQRILGAHSAADVLRDGLLDIYGTGFEALAQKLKKFEDAITKAKSKHPLQPVLVTDADIMIRERLSKLSSLSPERLSSLTSILLDYRLLDVAISLRLKPLPAGQPGRLPIPQPPKMFFKQMCHWPKLVTCGLQSLRDCGDGHGQDVMSSSNPILSIFSSLVHRKDTIEGHKIMANFECTAAHLSLVTKGITDFPNTVPEFQALVLKMCSNSDLHPNKWETFFSSIKSVHSFKLPLFLALSCSIVCLFLPSCLMTKDLNRLLLLQMWQGLGGARPERLVEVETILWRALFDSALGNHPLPTRFRAAFQEIEGLNLTEVDYPDSEWLIGNPSFQEATQKQFARKQLLSRPPSPPAEVLNAVAAQSSQKARSTRTDRTAAPATTIGSVSNVNASSSQRPTTRSVTAKVSHPAGGVAENQTQAPVYTASASPTRKNKKKKAAAPKQPIERTASPTPSISSSDDEPSHSRKRAISTSSEGQVPRSMKALKLEGGVRFSVIETIDLSVETRGPPVIDLTIDDDILNGGFNAESTTLWSDIGSAEYIARFHHEQEAQWFSSICRAVASNHSIDQGQALFLSSPEISWFTVVTNNVARQMSVASLHKEAKQAIIIVPDKQVTQSFDESSLCALSMLDRPVWIQDFSIPLDQPRLVAGTVNQLLQSVLHAGKALAVLDFPLPGGIDHLPSLASDAYAWNMTIDQPWCHRRWEIPRSAVSSTAISTRNTYQPFKFGPNGFTTQIEVKAGCQILIVCQPGPFNPHTFTSFAMIDQLQHLFLPDWKTLGFQAFHLKAGYTAIIKPLVPYFLLSTEVSIVHTGHFIATTTLEGTCTGFLISSVTLTPESNPSQKAAHSLLRRLVHYYHLVFTQPHFIDNLENFPHVPNILNCQGVIALLALCNVFELSNVILYTLSDFDRHLNVEARRLCCWIVAWLGAHFIYTSPQGTRLDVYYDIWLLFLARQTKAAVTYQTIVQHRSTNPATHDYRAKVDGVYRGNAALCEKMKGLLGWAGDDFGWPPDMIFSVKVRESPGQVPNDIQGETADDIEYFKTV